MKNIKFIIKLAIFLCIFSLLFVSISYIVRPDSDMKQRYTGFYAEDKDTIDAIMIGPSSVSPLIASPYIWNEFGITTYPLSTNAQPVAAVKYIIEEAQKTQRDALFIIDTTMFMVETRTLLTEPRIRNVIDNMKYSLTRFRAINELVENRAERLDYYFDISKYHSVILGEEGLKLDDIKYFDFENENIYKGYLFVDAVKIFEPIDVSHVIEMQAIPASAEEELIALMDYCSQNEVQVQFFCNPYILTDSQKMKNNYIEKLVNEHGYGFWDFNDLYEEMGIDFGKDFYNENHVNVYGAEKFSKILGEYLVETYGFNDKRNDEDYTSWNESYTAWSEQAEITKQKTDENLDKLNRR